MVGKPDREGVWLIVSRRLTMMAIMASEQFSYISLLALLFTCFYKGCGHRPNSDQNEGQDSNYSLSKPSGICSVLVLLPIDSIRVS